jgi:hypothetical protein
MIVNIDLYNSDIDPIDQYIKFLFRDKIFTENQHFNVVLSCCTSLLSIKTKDLCQKSKLE